MDGNPERVKIAIQKSGRLTDHSLDLLDRCGLILTKGKDQLFCYGENMPVDVLLVRDDDIPSLVNDKVCDLGIAGFNIVNEKSLAMRSDGREPAFKSVFQLDFGHCRLAIAAPEDRGYAGPSDLQGATIATSYVQTLEDFLDKSGVSADIEYFSGAVEIAPKLGKADFICDLVSTGTTLAANQLREVATVLESEAVVIQSATARDNGKSALVDKLLQRLDGVIQVRESKYIMLHAPRAALDEISRLLPGSEHPTIIPLDGNDEKVAVHAVCRENVFWETLENLKNAGASSLLVLPVEKMLS